jgi:hypothetical protein
MKTDEKKSFPRWLATGSANQMTARQTGVRFIHVFARYLYKSIVVVSPGW